MEKELQLAVLVISSHRNIAREFGNELSGCYEIENTEVRVETLSTSPKIGDERTMGEMVQEIFAIICIYIADQGDVSALLPAVNLYSEHPIKIIVHEPGVVIPADQAPNITKIAKTSCDDVVKALKARVGKGTSYGAPTELEVEMAEMITRMIPSIEMVRMVNSGTFSKQRTACEVWL